MGIGGWIADCLGRLELVSVQVKIEFVLERVLSEGPWMFDNQQVLMLRRWEVG